MSNMKNEMILLAVCATAMVAAVNAAGGDTRPPEAVEDPVELVDPMIGTVGTGHVFPGPCRPFGLVQPSPDTGNVSWRYCSGYAGDYSHGNEPCHHVVDLYRHVGQPEKADALTRRIIREFYKPRPDGLCGNDDCGQMSAWLLRRIRCGKIAH